MFILGVIPARGRSKGIPRKNIVDLEGKPLLVYDYERAKKSKYINKIVLSSEDEEILKVAKKYKIPALKRPSELAQDNSHIAGALKHAVRELEKKGFNFDIVVLLCPNVLIRKKGLIDIAIKKFIDENATSVRTVHEVGGFHPEWMLKMVDGKLIPYKKLKIYRRQELPPLFLHDCAVVVFDKKILMSFDEKRDHPNKIYGDKPLAVVVNREDVIDIDEPFDLFIARCLLKRCNNK